MPQRVNVAELQVQSSAFADHERIPERYTVDGENVSPPLSWSGVPEETAAFAIVMHDPDAPLVEGFTHWLAYGIDRSVRAIPEGGGDHIAGENSLGNRGYDGPAPPRGHGIHHYYFWVYALDEDVELVPGLDRHTLLLQIEDHVIEQARIVGVYSR